MKATKTKSKVKRLKLHKVRKPRDLNLSTKSSLFCRTVGKRSVTYIGVDRSLATNTLVDTATICLMPDEVHRLSQWLSRASAYLKQNKGV